MLSTAGTLNYFFITNLEGDWRRDCTRGEIGLRLEGWREKMWGVKLEDKRESR